LHAVLRARCFTKGIDQDDKRQPQKLTDEPTDHGGPVK
jgi:hypothetical protein